MSNLFLTKAIIPRFLKKLINIICYRGYSLYLAEYSYNKKVANNLSSVIITGTIINNGFHRVATAYIIIKIIDPYEPRKAIFNSDISLPFNLKQNLLISDVELNEKRKFSFTWVIPESLIKPKLYIKIDVWSPRKLYRKSATFYYPYQFDTSGWKGFIEIINRRNSMANLKIFISYAWVNTEHRSWVFGLTDFLERHGYEITIDRDLVPGQEITKFMEKKIEEADIVLMICSEVYTNKANDRIGGAGYETIITSKKFYESENKEKFIPVVKNNTLPSSKKIPTYLGSVLYVDMDVEDWQGEPLQKLIQAIERQKSIK